MSISGNDEPLPEKDVKLFLKNFTQKLIIWGSDDVIKSYSFYKNQLDLHKNSIEVNKHLLMIEKILLDIRKDTGHKNKNFKDGDLLNLFINDFHKFPTTNEA